MPGRILLMVVGALALCQTNIYDQTPNSRAVIAGAKTVSDYRLSPDGRLISEAALPSAQTLMHLPSVPRKTVPQLLGMLRQGAEIELFLGWVDPESQPGEFQHHIEIFRGRHGSEATFVHDFTLVGGPSGDVSFFQPPDARDTPAALINIQGGAYWGTTYLLSPDRQSVQKMFEASDYEYADLDRDGIYELIAWNRRPFDVRCSFGIFGVRFYPEVFVRDGAGYKKAWPPPEWAVPDGEMVNRLRQHRTGGVSWGANIQVVAGLADLKNNGTAQLIVLQDRLRDEPAQALAVYGFERKSFRLSAQTPLPVQRIAYLLLGTRDSPAGKQILLRAASRAKCDAGGDPEGSETVESAYMLEGNHLLPVEPYNH